MAINGNTPSEPWFEMFILVFPARCSNVVFVYNNEFLTHTEDR